MRRSAKNVYSSMKSTFVATRYKLAVAAADKYSNNNPFLVGRITNSIQKELNKCQNIPKMVLIILEDDMIKDIKTTDREQAEQFFIIYTQYLVKTVQEMIQKFNHILPENAKRNGWPKTIFILPTVHRNYQYDELRLRQILGDVIEHEVKDKENIWALKLLQIWDKNDLNNVRADTNAITQDGLINFWKSVDRTIRFSDKRILRAEAACDNNPFQSSKKPNNPNQRKNEETVPDFNTDRVNYSRNRTWYRPGFKNNN